MINYYEMLGISQKSSTQEIKAAIADKVMDGGVESYGVYKEIYKLLTNPQQKKAYDEKLLKKVEEKYSVREYINIPQPVYGPPSYQSDVECVQNDTPRRIHM